MRAGHASCFESPAARGESGSSKSIEAADQVCSERTLWRKSFQTDNGSGDVRAAPPLLGKRRAHARTHTGFSPWQPHYARVAAAAGRAGLRPCVGGVDAKLSVKNALVLLLTSSWASIKPELLYLASGLCSCYCGMVVFFFFWFTLFFLSLFLLFFFPSSTTNA